MVDCGTVKDQYEAPNGVERMATMLAELGAELVALKARRCDACYAWADDRKPGEACGNGVRVNHCDPPRFFACKIWGAKADD